MNDTFVDALTLEEQIEYVKTIDWYQRAIQRVNSDDVASFTNLVNELNAYREAHKHYYAAWFEMPNVDWGQIYTRREGDEVISEWRDGRFIRITGALIEAADERYVKLEGDILTIQQYRARVICWDELNDIYTIVRLDGAE